MIAGSLVAAIGCEDKKTSPPKPSGTTPASGKTTESGTNKTTESGSQKTTEPGTHKTTTGGEGTKTGTKTETKKPGGDGPSIDPPKGDKDKPKKDGDGK